MDAQRTSVVAETWMSLSRAAAFLGVHPGTLRLWADQGKVPVQRTPGGHRRFRRSDLEAVLTAGSLPQGPSSLQAVVYSALGRVRLGMGEGSLAAAPWYRQLSETAREQHRAIGRRLLGALLRYLSSPADRGALLDEARTCGQSYGEFSRHQGVALEEAVRAFLFFRDTLADSVIGLSDVFEPRQTHNWGETLRQVNAFTDEVLLALIRAYAYEGVP